MTIESINVEGAAKPVAPYSPAVRANEFTFLSGQIGLDPETDSLVEGDAAAQMEQALKNLTTLVEAAGKTLVDVARVGIYLTDMGDFAAVNEVYGRFFGEPYPARTAIGVAALPLGASVEVDAIVS